MPLQDLFPNVELKHQHALQQQGKGLQDQW